MARLLVTGSRTITDPRIVAYALCQVVHDLGPVAQLVHGGAKGVDQLAGIWAWERGIPVLPVPPDFRRWPASSRLAYLKRDELMVDEYATHVTAIWDGASSGTRYTFEYARQKGKLHSIWREEHVREELDG